MSRVALVGGTGFVGTAVAQALADHDVVRVSAPRLSTTARTPEALIRAAQSEPTLADVAPALAGCDVLINAAGMPDASSLDRDALFGANALLPRLLLEAAALAGVHRLVHVSSAVVQNDKAVLDDSEVMRPFSPYSASKVAGELVLRHAPPAGVHIVRYRPPSVHAPGRRVTRMIGRIASSPMATVARPGDQQSPQALLPNVGAAVAFLATCQRVPPAVVTHPREGVTAAGLMRDLSGGAEPHVLPRWLARGVVGSAKLAGRVHRPTAANARRIELLWFGQGQSSSWLTSQGFSHPVGPEGWQHLSLSERMTSWTP